MVAAINGGNQTVPTVLFPDGTARHPSLAEVTRRLGEHSRRVGGDGVRPRDHSSSRCRKAIASNGERTLASLSK